MSIKNVVNGYIKKYSKNLKTKQGSNNLNGVKNLQTLKLE
jgi:hypothetical protein